MLFRNCKLSCTTSRWVLSFIILACNALAQIDTRITPSPTAVEQSVPEPNSSSKQLQAPLIGFLNETLGSTLKEDLEATLGFSESETNQTTAVPSSSLGFDEVSRITGTLNLHRDWSRASILMQYAGGSDFYRKNSYLDAEFHRFSATQAFHWSRWNLSLGQDFSYLPQSQFGFDPAHAIGSGMYTATSATFLPGPNLFLPVNIIERTASGNINAQYVLGARSGLTFNGNISDLHFSGTSPGITLVDSQALTGGANYIYALDARNSAGIAYSFTQGRTFGFASLIRSHSAMAIYEHKLGRGWKVYAGAGPQFTTFSATGVEAGLGTSATVKAGMNYERGLLTVGTSYFRGINPGIGLFLGSASSTVSGFVNRQFGRSLRASVSIGYARNGNLGIPSLNRAQRINSTYVAATIERDMGRMLSGFISYTMQNQDTDASLCGSGGCIPFPMIQSGTIGLRFRFNPVRLKR